MRKTLVFCDVPNCEARHEAESLDPSYTPEGWGAVAFTDHVGRDVETLLVCPAHLAEARTLLLVRDVPPDGCAPPAIVKVVGMARCGWPACVDAIRDDGAELPPGWGLLELTRKSEVLSIWVCPSHGRQLGAVLGPRSEFGPFGGRRHAGRG